MRELKIPSQASGWIECAALRGEAKYNVTKIYFYLSFIC